MDELLDNGALWRLVRDPEVGEWIGMVKAGHPFYGYVTTPTPAFPTQLVIYYWDDGEWLHLEHCEKGDQPSNATF